MQVRSPFQSSQYPASLCDLYKSTPDESLPDFYTSPAIFHATGGHMPDIQLPEWADNVDSFLQLHRCVCTLHSFSDDLVTSGCCFYSCFLLRILCFVWSFEPQKGFFGWYACRSCAVQYHASMARLKFIKARLPSFAALSLVSACCTA
jgi:Fe-S-cluster formation regulator IscX/YfhJ